MQNRLLPLLCALALLSGVLAQFPNTPNGYYNYYNNNTEKCINKNIVIQDRNYTFDDLNRLRDSRSNNLDRYFRYIFAYIKSKETTYLVKATGPWGPLLIATMSIAFVSWLILIVWACGVCKKVHNRCLEEFTVVWACILFWIFIALWITLIVYTGLSIYWGGRSFCAYLSVPEAHYYGSARINNATNIHNGLINTAMTLGNFTLEIVRYTETPAGLAAFRNIINANLPASYKALNTSLEDFYNSYKNQMIVNAEGGLHMSRTMWGFYYHFIDPRIQFDTEILGNATNKLHVAAQTLINYGSARTRSISTLRAAMVQVVRQYYTFTASWAFSWEYFMDGLIRNEGWARNGVWSLFALTTANAFLLMFIMFVVFAICCYRKCMRCVCFSKILLLFVALFTVGVFIVDLVLLFGTVLVSGHCFYLSQMNQPFPNTTVIQDVGITINEPTRVIWRKCYDVNENPSILEVTADTPRNNIYYNDAVNIIDGLTSYPTFNYYSSNNNLRGYSFTYGNWSRTFSGETVDYNDIDGNLNILNQAISCGNIVYAIKTAGCPKFEGFTCRTIDSDGSISLPGCTAASNVTVATDIFNNLKLYTNSMNTVFGNMLASFNAPGGPWDNFNKTSVALRAQSSNFGAMQAAFPNTYALANMYNYTFTELTNCSLVRKQLVLTEDIGCFYGNYSIYTFLIISIVAGFILFILEWCICGALREQDNIVYAPPVTSQPTTVINQPTTVITQPNYLIATNPSVGQAASTVVNQKQTQLYNFDDFEVVPVY